MTKIRNVRGSWFKFIGKPVRLWIEDSCWDGSGEYIYTFVQKITNKGVWFWNNPGSDVTSFWVNFNKLNGYLVK